MLIDQLPEITTANDADEMPIEQGTTTRKIKFVNLLKDVVKKAGDTMTGALNLNVPLAIASGGTGASTASSALAALNGLSKISAYYQDDVIDTMTDGTALLRTSGLVNTSLYNALGDNYAYVVQIFYSAIGSTRNRMQLAFPYGKTINKIAWREYNSTTSPAWGDWHVIRNGTESVTGITVPQSATGVATMPSVSAVRTGNTVQVTISNITLANTPPSSWVTIATGLPAASANYYTHIIESNGQPSIQLRVRVTTSGAMQVAYGEGRKTYSSSLIYVCDN